MGPWIHYKTSKGLQCALQPHYNTVIHWKNFALQLIDTSMDQASDVFKLNEDHELLAALKMAGLDGQKEKVDELSVKFEEHSEQLQEASWSTFSSLLSLYSEILYGCQPIQHFSHRNCWRLTENFALLRFGWASRICVGKTKHLCQTSWIFIRFEIRQ